nr:fibronectin type III domain-containing protein [Microcella frigidaquae]
MLILQQTNELRARNGLPPLRLNSALHSIAQDWSTQQARVSTMSHRPNFTSLYPSGWTYAAENVAAGYSPGSVVTAWAASPGHRANMLSSATDIGIGVATDSRGRYYFTQNFARYNVPFNWAPSAPRAVSAPVNDGSSLTVTWEAPSNSGAGALVDYVVQIKRSTSTTWTTVADGVSLTPSHTFTRPTTGVVYNIRVRAKNIYGAGAYSSVLTVRAGAPAAPTSMVVPTNEGSRLTVAWNPPTNVGAGPVTDYTIQIKRSTSTTWTTVSDGVSTNPSHTFTRTTPGVTYDVRVRAVNAAGAGALSTVLTVKAGAPTAPTALAAPVNDGTSLTVSWAAPANSGSGPVTDYVIQIKRSTSSTWSTVSDGVSTNLSHTFTNTTAGVTYNVRVQARNGSWAGLLSSVLTVRIPTET